MFFERFFVVASIFPSSFKLFSVEFIRQFCCRTFIELKEKIKNNLLKKYFFISNCQIPPFWWLLVTQNYLQAPSTWKGFALRLSRGWKFQNCQFWTFTKTDWMLLPIFKLPSLRRCKKYFWGRKITIHRSLQIFLTFFGKFPLGISHK